MLSQATKHLETFKSNFRHSIDLPPERSKSIATLQTGNPKNIAEVPNRTAEMFLILQHQIGNPRPPPACWPILSLRVCWDLISRTSEVLLRTCTGVCCFTSNMSAERLFTSWRQVRVYLEMSRSIAAKEHSYSALSVCSIRDWSPSSPLGCLSSYLHHRISPVLLLWCRSLGRQPPAYPGPLLWNQL